MTTITITIRNEQREVSKRYPLINAEYAVGRADYHLDQLRKLIAEFEWSTLTNQATPISSDVAEFR